MTTIFSINIDVCFQSRKFTIVTGVQPWQMTAALWSGQDPVSEEEHSRTPVSFPEHVSPYSTTSWKSSPNTPLDTGMAPVISEKWQTELLLFGSLWGENAKISFHLKDTLLIISTNI